MTLIDDENTGKPLFERLTRREIEILDLLAVGLTSKEMAEHLTLAVSSVRWYVQQIYGKLGVKGKRQAINRACELGLIKSAPGLVQNFPSLDTQAELKQNLPVQLTSFIGREKEIAQIGELFQKGRFVTLTGPGGTGKTRLAIQAGIKLLGQYEDGVWLVELGPLSDPELVTQTS